MRTRAHLLVRRHLIRRHSRFSGVFYSVHSNLVACSASLHVRFIGHPLLRVLKLSSRACASHFCRKRVTNSVFEVCVGKRGVLRSLLGGMHANGDPVPVPRGTFVRRGRRKACFPISNRIMPVFTGRGVAKVTVMYHGVSRRRVREHFFGVTIRRDSVCP